MSEEKNLERISISDSRRTKECSGWQGRKDEEDEEETNIFIRTRCLLLNTSSEARFRMYVSRFTIESILRPCQLPLHHPDNVSLVAEEWSLYRIE